VGTVNGWGDAGARRCWRPEAMIRWLKAWQLRRKRDQLFHELGVMIECGWQGTKLYEETGEEIIRVAREIWRIR
jgi:hypothetical protein